MKHFHHAFSVAGLAAAVLAVFVPVTISRGADWQVKEAPIRFKLLLSEGPSHKSCGYVVRLPNGGILPAPYPATQVVTEDGKTLASYVLWHSRGAGLSLVFEDPEKARNVYVYVSAGAKLNVWTPQSGLTPGPVLCADGSQGSLEAAKNLSKLGSVGSRIYYDSTIPPPAPLVIQFDPWGRPQPCSFYLLAYVTTKDPGSTWVAPIAHGGPFEVRINGQPLAPQERSKKDGGSGQMVDISAKLHRVDMFAACTGSGPLPSRGVLWVTWKPPHATVEELGGVRAKDVPFPGTPMWESRMLRPDEIAQSGRCTIQEINMQDGGPIARFRPAVSENYWVGDEPPVYIYELTAETDDNPKGTEYRWSFGDAAKTTGPKAMWFFPGGKDVEATLTAVAGEKQSRCTIPFFVHGGAQTSMNAASTRQNFRTAFLNMIKAYPDDADPAATWDKSMWDVFYEVQEVGKGAQLLADVLVNRTKSFKPKIPPDKQIMLQDALFHSLSHMAPDKALEWLKDEEKDSRNPERRNDFKIMQAEVYLYHKKNFAEAKSILTTLAAQGTTEAAAMASIRLGDAAFLERNVNEASRYWGSVQTRAKLTDAVLKGEDAVKWRDPAEDEKKKEAKPPPPEKDKDKKAVRPPLKPLVRKPSVDNWKKSAILDTSMAASVITLINQGAFTDALRQLQMWERNFPKSKMSSDYIIQEARFYMAIGNNQRARAMLEAYCDNVDASSYGADATELLLQCMINDKEPDDVMAKFCEKTKKRFQFHPFADRVDTLLQQLRAKGVKTSTTGQ